MIDCHLLYYFKCPRTNFVRPINVYKTAIVLSTKCRAPAVEGISFRNSALVEACIVVNNKAILALAEPENPTVCIVSVVRV
jgi:hypothetical protein